MSTQWYVNRNGKHEGPLTGAQLKQLADNKQLQPDDLVWKEGLADWIPARQIKGLFPTSSDAVVQAASASSAQPYTVVADTAASQASESFPFQPVATTRPSPTTQYYQPSSEDVTPNLIRTGKTTSSFSGNWFYDFLTFRRMITPILIQIMFWIGAVAWVIYGMYLFVDGLIPKDRRPEFIREMERELIRELQNSPFKEKMKDMRSTKSDDEKSDIRQSIIGLLVSLLMPFIWRLICEELIVFFRMNETLTDVRNALKRM